MALAFLPGYEYNDDIYEVEKIVDCELRNGVYLYRVRWQGCPREQDTWEPEENLLTCDDLLKTFKEERESRRKKRKQKRRERRNEYIRNSEPLHVKVKEEGGGSDSDEVTIDKKKAAPAPVSPSSDMDEIDLSGLTRKQRLSVLKVIEQSKKDAELASPTSSTTDENEQYKRVTFTKKTREDGSSSKDVISRKKKKIGKVPVIDETSDSDGPAELLEEGVKKNCDNSNERPSSSKNIPHDNKRSQESGNSENIELKNTEEPIQDISQSNLPDICNEDVERNKGKKPSEILGNIFGTPEKTITSPIRRIQSSPGCTLSSPVSILCISDDSNDEHVLGKQSSKRSLIDSEQDYVPLLDQLQMRMDPLLTTSMLQTSIELDNPDRMALPKLPADPYKIQNTEMESNIGGNYPEKTIDTNSSKDDPKQSLNVSPAEKEKITNASVPNLLTGIPSSSTLKLDVGNNKRTYMKGVENIRNTLAMKRMLMNPDATNNDKKRKENVPDCTSNSYTETVVSETVIDQGAVNKESRGSETTRMTEPFQRSLSDSGNLHRVRQVISSFSLSGNKNDNSDFNIDFQKGNLSDKSSGSVSITSNNEACASRIRSPTYTTCNTENVEKDNLYKSSNQKLNNKAINPQRSNEPRSSTDQRPSIDPRTSIDSRSSNDPRSSSDSRSSSDQRCFGDTRSSVDPRSSIDPRIAAKPLGNHPSKSNTQKRIPLHKSSSSPAVPNAMKISRSEKLLNAMKSATSTKRPEKSKKLSLKEYNAKKASKQNQPPQVAPMIEFTKIPSIQSISSENSTPKVTNTSADKVNVILPPPPPKSSERRVSIEKKEKGPKPNQIATNTDVIGNIMECFKQPLGRDSTSKPNLEKGSPVHPKEMRDTGPPEVLNFDADVDDLDEYSGDEDGMLRNSVESTTRQTHLNLPHANTKILDLLTIYQAMLRGDIETLIRCDIRDEKINAYVDEQDTLIMKSVVLRSQSAAQILLEKKADPDKPSKLGPRQGKTPLMVAVEMNQKSMVSLLVQNNARMNTQTQNGETALIMAAKLGHMEIIHVLLNSGADAKPAATYLEKKITDVPMNLLPELQRTLQHHSEKLKEITEKFLKDFLNSRSTQIGQSLMPLRCVSPDEMNKHEFYFKCNVNAVEPRIHVLLLALPVTFKLNGGIDVKFALTDNGVKSVYLNDGQMPPTSPGSSFVYFLFPKYGEINTLRIESTNDCKHKLLLSIYSMSYTERIDKTPGHINRTMLIQAAASAPVPVH